MSFTDSGTLQEGLKVTACSAALEGLVDGGVSILEHKQERGKIRNFEKEDWKEIGIDTAKGVGKGAVRGAAVYAATNVAHKLLYFCRALSKRFMIQNRLTHVWIKRLLYFDPAGDLIHLVHAQFLHVFFSRMGLPVSLLSDLFSFSLSFHPRTWGMLWSQVERR